LRRRYPELQDYRFAGAAECIASPVDVVAFNEVLQQIVRVNGQAAPHPPREAEVIKFSGVNFRPHQNLVLGPEAKSVHLTTAESLLLSHFVANPWEIQTRGALAEALYGKHRPATDRAIDVVVNGCVPNCVDWRINAAFDKNGIPARLPLCLRHVGRALGDSSCPLPAAGQW
jgi:hypothetical protein